VLRCEAAHSQSGLHGARFSKRGHSHGRHWLPSLALLAMVTQSLCFAGGGSLLAGLRPGPTRHRPGDAMLQSRLQLAGVLDDMGKGILDAAASAATGMSTKERDGLVAKLLGGNMDFNDFLTMFMMMKNQGGATTVLNSASSIPGLKSRLGLDTAAAEDTEAELATASKIIAAMTEEEREQPGYYLVGDAARARISALATKAEVEEVAVDAFLKKFSSMKDFFIRLGVGVSEGKSQEQVAKEMEREAKEEGKSAPRQTKGTPFINPARAAKKAAKAAARRRVLPPRSKAPRGRRVRQ